MESQLNNTRRVNNLLNKVSKKSNIILTESLTELPTSKKITTGNLSVSDKIDVLFAQVKILTEQNEYLITKLESNKTILLEQESSEQQVIFLKIGDQKLKFIGEFHSM